MVKLDWVFSSKMLKSKLVVKESTNTTVTDPIWNELTQTAEKQSGYANMVGNVPNGSKVLVFLSKLTTHVNYYAYRLLSHSNLVSVETLVSHYH